MNLDDMPDIPPDLKQILDKYPKEDENENTPDVNPGLLPAAFHTAGELIHQPLDMNAVIGRNRTIVEVLYGLRQSLSSAEFWLKESAAKANKLIGVQAAANNVVDELARLAGAVHTHLTLVEIHHKAFTELVNAQTKQVDSNET